MVKFSSLTTMLAVIVLGLISGCSNDEPQATPTSPSPSLSASTPAPALLKSQAASPSVSPQINVFNDATDAAASAATITQSAESKDDWNLVVSRWQKAIQLMKTVPSNSKNYATAQKKLVEYQRNLAYAVKQANSPPKPVLPALSSPTVTQPQSTPGALPTSSPQPVGTTPTPSATPTSSPTTNKSS